MYSSLRFELVFKKGKLTVASANVKSLHRFSKVQNRFLLYIFLAFLFSELESSGRNCTLPSTTQTRYQKPFSDELSSGQNYPIQIRVWTGNFVFDQKCTSYNKIFTRTGFDDFGRSGFSVSSILASIKPISAC